MNNKLIKSLVQNKELFTIILAVIFFSVSVGKALSLADDGLDTANKVNNILSGTSSEPGIVEKIRVVESEVSNINTKLDKLIVLADSHDRRINSLELTRHTSIDAAKDREIFVNMINKLREDINQYNIVVIQRLTHIEAKLDK